MPPLVTPDALRTVLDLPPDIGPGDPYTVALTDVTAAADAAVTPYLIPDVDHSTHPACREAATHVAVDLWQSRTAAGGQPVALDFAPGAYRLSRFLLSSVSALLGPCRDARSLVG